MLFKRIEDKSNLGVFFNAVFKEVDMLKMTVSPHVATYERYRKDKHKHTATMAYYEFLLFEEYLHSICTDLRDWKQKAIAYNDEFESSWKYYALVNNRKMIEQYGGAENDYDKEGNIRTDFTDKEIVYDSIVSDLQGDNSTNIFLTTIPADLNIIYNSLQNKSEVNIFKFFESQGTPLKSYRQDENGNMVENSWTDQLLNKITEQHQCDTMADTLFSVVVTLNSLIAQVNKLKPKKDNKEFFENLPNKIDAILELRISLTPLNPAL